jgi:bifunctional UDP-N-acetylglucosamine pyrophosphorylase/glucosamine-1-phosphate N-acetyltransferase
MKMLKLWQLKRMGVSLVGKEIYVQKGATIGRGAVLYAPCYVLGDSVVGQNAVLYPCCRIFNSTVGENSVIDASVVENSTVKSGCTVGPFAHLRAGTVVENGCRVGNFVEIKNSVLSEGCKTAHLSYVGDASLGRNVNVGCGVAFANYDGIKKQKIVVGDGAFIGCNSNLVAPVSVGDGAYVACGTTVVDDLENGDFCVGRCRVYVKKGGAKGRFNG